jgi:regulator of CtrA degradation
MWQFRAMGEHSIMDGQLAPKLIDGLYVEAMVLADEARSYFDTCESLKVTTRLMHVIAWLLTQRAVNAGELSRAQAGTPERRLGAAADTDRDLLRRLPETAVELIRASEELYGRVSRLDQGSGAEDTVSPARSLLSRLQRSF